MSRRVGDWIPFHCGDVVHDEADPRHAGRVEAIINGAAKIKWLETGWFSENVPLHKLCKHEETNMSDKERI